VFGARVAALAVLAAALLLTAVPGAAPAAGFAGSGGGDLGVSVPGNQSAGDQYVETLPTTKGPRAPGRKKHAKRLSNAVTRKLQKLGGSEAATLKALATSPALGAPVDTGDAKGKNGSSDGKGSHDRRSGSGKRHDSSAPAVPSAAINAVDGGDAGLGWLVLAILAITALSLGAVGYRRRRDKGSTE
jgi:hypothetical protein